MAHVLGLGQWEVSNILIRLIRKTKDWPDGAMVARSPPKVEVDGSSPSSVDIFALQSLLQESRGYLLPDKGKACPSRFPKVRPEPDGPPPSQPIILYLQYFGIAGICA